VWRWAAIGGALLLVLRLFFIQAFSIQTDALAPELPAGSHVLVWKPGRPGPGDLVAFRHEGLAKTGRVSRVEDETIWVTRNDPSVLAVPRRAVVGTIISVFWRGSAPHPQYWFSDEHQLVLPEPTPAHSPPCGIDFERAELVTPPDELADPLTLGLPDLGRAAERWVQETGVDAVVNMPNRGRLRLLGGVAFSIQDQGRSLRWDAEKEEIAGDPDANRWLSREYRKPWELPRIG